MVDSENTKRMSNVLSQPEHIAQIFDDVKRILLQLQIIYHEDDVTLKTINSSTANFTILCIVDRPHYSYDPDDFFPDPLNIIINPLHGAEKRELRVTIVEGQELIFIDEHEPQKLQMDTDDNCFHVEERLFVIELLDKLVEIREKALAGKIVLNKR